MGTYLPSHPPRVDVVGEAIIIPLFWSHCKKQKIVETSIVPTKMNLKVLSGTSSAASTLACAYVLRANLAHTDDLATPG
jgi:hypothetical protein